MVVMQTEPYPKTAVFRSSLQKLVTLQTEIFTVDSAIQARDAIRERIGDCRDEDEARKHLGDLTRAEESVIIKQARLPRQQAELGSLIEQTFDAFSEAHSEWSGIIHSSRWQSAEAFRELLHAAQLDPEVQKVEKANPIVVDAIRPLALAEKLDDLLYEAWKAANITSDLPDKRATGLREAIQWLDKVRVALAEVHAEDKRMVAACEAFRKVLANG